MKKKLSIIIALLLVAIFSINVGAASFKDLNGHWAKNYIEGQVNMGLLTGYPDGTFKPDKNLTNAEAITVINKLTRVFKVKDINFTDVKPNDWYYNQYKIAVYTGFVQDKHDKAYPNKFISRGEISTMLGIVYGIEPNYSINLFKDVDSSTLQGGYINALCSLGVIQGYPDGTFKPNNALKRGEYSTLLNVIYTRMSNPARYPVAYLYTNKTALNNLLINGSNYADGLSTSTREDYVNAYLNAKLVADNQKAIQTEIDLAVEKLEKAVDEVDSERYRTRDNDRDRSGRRHRRPSEKEDDNQGWAKPDDDEEVKKPELKKDALKATIEKANVLEKLVNTDFYRSNYSNALNNFLNALNEANKQVNYDNTTQNAIDKAEKDLADMLDAFNATDSEIEQIKNALNALKDANKNLQNSDLDADIAKADKALENGMLHHEADAILNMLLEDLKAVKEHLGDVAYVNELKDKALKDLQAIIDGRIIDLKDSAGQIKGALENETENLEKIYDLVQKASQLKAQYDQALEDLENMGKAADKYQKLLDSLNLPAGNDNKAKVQAIIDEANNAAKGTDDITTNEIKEIWNKLNSINTILKDEIEFANAKKALENQIEKVEKFAKDKGITLSPEDAAKVKEANDLLKDATATKKQVDAKKKELEEILTNLSRANRKAVADKENIDLAEAAVKDDATLTDLKTKKDALVEANKGTDQAAIDKASEELKKELANVLPIKLVYKDKDKDIEGDTVPFDMSEDMSFEAVMAMITPQYANGKEIDATELKVDITSETSESLVVRDDNGKIVSFRKPSNNDKIRIKYTYTFAGKTYEGTLEYRSQDSGKRFQNIIGIYRALEGEEISINFFKNYDGGKAALFDIKSGKDVSDLLKVKIMKDGKQVQANISGKYSKGEYDLVFYYTENEKEVAYTGISKLIIDPVIKPEDLIYIYNPENAEYFVPMKDNDGKIIFGFNINNAKFVLPETVRISVQDTGATFLTLDGNADIKIKFVNENGNDIKSKDDIKDGTIVFAVLLEDIEGDLGDRKVTFEAGKDEYQVPVVRN